MMTPNAPAVADAPLAAPGDTVTIPLRVVLPDGRAPLQGTWTAEDWTQLDHSAARYEIIERVLYVSTAPSFFHQWVIKRCERCIGIPAEDRKLAVGMFAPIGVFMPGSDPVQPDYVVVRWERLDIIRDRRIYGVPDLIIEVLSSNREYDETTKWKAYAKAGVPEYALVDLAARRMRLYTEPDDDGYEKFVTFKEAEEVTFACLPGISFALDALFAGAPDTTL